MSLTFEAETPTHPESNIGSAAEHRGSIRADVYSAALQPVILLGEGTCSRGFTLTRYMIAS
jgi:hypothetical protein